MNTQLQPVPFHQDTIFVVDYLGQPFVPLRPLAENMGLDWKSQYAKVMARPERFSVVMVTTQMPGDDQRREVVCIPLKKINAWLYSISPDKVAPHLKEKIELYQEECDEVLFNYWFNGVGLPDRQMAGQQSSQSLFVAAQEELLRLYRKCESLMDEKIALLEARKKKRVNRPVTEEEKQEIVAMVASGISQSEVAKKMRRSSATVSYLVSERLRAAGVAPINPDGDGRQMELFPTGVICGESA